MLSVTSNVFEPKDNLMKDFNIIVNGAFVIDKYRERQIRSRIAIKDYDVTDWDIEEDVAKKEEIKKQPPEWLLSKVRPPKTREYLAIKQKTSIKSLINHVQEIIESLQNENSRRMSLAILKNEIYVIYKTFLEDGRNEHFLSIVNLLEDLILRKEIDKNILKECILFLKRLMNKETVEYSDYRVILKRFMEKGVDIVSIEESADEK
jgi:hypothetical protein